MSTDVRRVSTVWCGGCEAVALTKPLAYRDAPLIGRGRGERA